jgi:nucleoside-diphosphate-sugar epimerase
LARKTYWPPLRKRQPRGLPCSSRRQPWQPDVDLDESTPLADEVAGSHPYTRTKATADKRVLAANAISSKGKDGRSLRTACIRLPIVYGECDNLVVPDTLAVLANGRTNFHWAMARTCGTL